METLNNKQKIALIIVAVIVLYIVHKYYYELRGMLGIDKYVDIEKSDKKVKGFEKDDVRYLRMSKGKAVKKFKIEYNKYIDYIRKKGIKCSCKKVNKSSYFTPRDEKNIQRLADDIAANEKANRAKIKKLDPFTGLAISIALFSINSTIYNDKGEVVKEKSAEGPFVNLNLNEKSVFALLKEYDITP